MSDTTKEKLSLIRKYIFEVVLIVLVMAVSYLFKETQRMNDVFNSHLINDELRLIKAIENSNEILTFYNFKKQNQILN